MFMLCPQLASAKYIDTWIKFIIIIIIIIKNPFLESIFIAKQELITLSFVYKTSRQVRISLLISNLNKEFFFFLGKVIL